MEKSKIKKAEIALMFQLGNAGTFIVPLIFKDNKFIGRYDEYSKVTVDDYSSEVSLIVYNMKKGRVYTDTLASLHFSRFGDKYNDISDIFVQVSDEEDSVYSIYSKLEKKYEEKLI